MVINEAILLKRFASTGDAEAFAEIVQLHAPLVYGVCLRILEDSDKAADAVQDTFVQLVRDVSRIRGSLPNWLHRVATHKAIDLIRRDSLRKQSEAEFAANSEKMQPMGEYVTWHDISVYIDKELDDLDNQMREVLILRFLEGLTTTEIAEKCNISQPTVSRRLESGVGLLRHKLKSRGIVVPAVVLTAMLTENVIKAAPALVMRELGKIALSGGKAAIGIKAAVGLSTIKTKIISVAVVTIIAGSAVWYYNYNSSENPVDIQQTNAAVNSGLFLDQNSFNVNQATIVVTDQYGNPLSDLKVTEIKKYKEYITDENGRFTCEVSDEAIDFHAADMKRKLYNSASLNPGQRFLAIQLKPARVITGQVVDSEGKPVPYTTIKPMGGGSVLSDGEGRFAAGWFPEWEPTSGICLKAQNFEHNLAAVTDISRQIETIKMELTPALTLKGIVTNPEGVPLSDAKMMLVLRKWRWGNFFLDKTFHTDDKGQFEFPTLPQFQEYEINIKTGNYSEVSCTIGLLNTIKDTVQLEPIVLYPKQDTPKDIEYGQLFLNVFDENNKAIDIAEVHIGDNKDYFQRNVKPFIVTSTDKPGFYKIEKIPVGYHPVMSINVLGYALFQQTDVIIEKDSPKTINCVLKKGGMIEGHVVNNQGEPVEGLPVKIKSVLYVKDLETDDNGHFYADHMPDMRYSVVAEPPSESQYTTTVFRGDVTCDQKDIKIIVQDKKETKRKSSLVSKSILQFEEIKIDCDESKIKNKNLLICFFDFEQRPSRSLLIELNKKMLELKIRDIIVVAVQVSMIEDNILNNEWLKENKINFTVGKFQGKEETLSNWGVTALPWLILTDKNHTVTAEGFSIAELDEKIGNN